MLTFVLAAAARIKHFSFVPLVNQWEIIFRAVERPWAGGLARRLSAPLSALFCLCASDRIHQTERSQSRELPSVSLTRISPGLYHITGRPGTTQRTAAKQPLQPGPSSPALLAATYRRRLATDGSEDGRTREKRTFRQALVASLMLGC